MGSLDEHSESLRLLSGLENGTLDAADAYNIAKERDPVLLYFILRFLRENYPPSSPQSKGVIERLVELTGTYTDLVAMAKEGERDPMREWFDDGYTTQQFRANSEEYLTLIVDKFEG